MTKYPRPPGPTRPVSVHPDEQYVVEDRVIENRSLPVRLSQLVWLLNGLLEAAIGLRVFLKLIAANPASPFAALVYAFTDLCLWPFNGLTAAPAAGGMVLEISSLIAMVVYAVIAWGVVQLVWILFDPSRSRVRIRDRYRRYR
ncbi:MAG: YggT family protein [Anaerolineaceae bacterium]|nr:YggT family protein [Anaerolineaceae bacterium]